MVIFTAIIYPNRSLNNYKLIIQYDGTGYSGWQIQKGQMTVQQKITESIEIILKEKVNLIGSGRTDTGVHALGQQANFRTEQEIDLQKVLYSLNSILPKDISILDLEKVDENFHARFDAKKRSYIYLISKYKSPFYDKYSWFYHFDINCAKLNLFTKSILGRQDFSSFSRKKTDTQNKVCEIYEAHWKESRGMVIFYISADRFLHGMVRAITGTLLFTLKNNLEKEYIEEVVQTRDREKAAEAVPAKGLFLFKVKY
jgi:tRNA pseudouridine38-40 synthase